MAEIINLKRARKARERQDRDAKAAENRTRFGRSKAEREAEDARRSQADRLLEGHRREDPDGAA